MCQLLRKEPLILASRCLGCGMPSMYDMCGNCGFPYFDEDEEGTA